MIRVLALLLIVASVISFSCRSNDSGDSGFSSIEATTWIVYAKWNTDPDTAMFRPWFDAGGKGVQVDSGGKPTGIAFTWTQDKQTVKWSYPSKVRFTGTLSSNGDTMSGTGTYQSKKSDWWAVKR